jgi:DNA-binding MarR family transcriptional regulator
LAGQNPFDQLLGYHVRRLSVLVMADLSARLAPLGLKPADASVLFAIAAHGPITQSDLGKMLGIQRANMAPLIAALDRRGLIQRDAVDGRSQALSLTADGVAMHGQTWALTQAHEAELFSILDETDRALMIGRLRGLWQDATNGDGS